MVQSSEGLAAVSPLGGTFSRKIATSPHRSRPCAKESALPDPPAYPARWHANSAAGIPLSVPNVGSAK